MKENEKLEYFLNNLEWAYGSNYLEIDEARETAYNLLKEFQDGQKH